MTDYLLTLYNSICEKAYEDHPNADYDSPEFEAVLNSCQREWADSIFADSKGSVNDVLMTLEFNELTKLFEKLCESDFPMPKAVLTGLARFDRQTGEYLVQNAFSMMERKDQPDVYISIQAVKALGRLKLTRYIPSLVAYIENLPSHEELFIESVAEGLMDMGHPAISPIIESINKALEVNNNMEYMLQVLSQLGRVHKSPEVFNCLKSSFLRMANKDLGALCIAEYNDVRGVAFLRTWLESNQGELSRESYYEILHCIKALGGRVDLF